MRNAVFTCLAVLLLGIPARQALSSPSRQADDYFKVRDQAQVLDTAAYDEVQTQPQKFDGKLIEVRGIITAIAGSDSQTTLLVEGAPGAAPTPLVLPADKRLTNWPFLDVGISFRALCRVVTTGGSSSGSLELVIPVKEYDAAGIDQARAKIAAAKKAEEDRRKARTSLTTQLASRSFGGVVRGAAPITDYSSSQLVGIYARAVRYFNRRLTASEARTIAGIIINYSRRYQLDARLVMAVIACESNFNSHAVSPVGAMGLGQLMPGTASGLGVGNAFDMEQNLNGSTRLLKDHIENMSRGARSDEEAVKLALACYNAGAGAVKKYRGIPPYRETQNYVKKIMRLYHQMCGDAA